MVSAFSGLNTVVRGLMAQQMALNTVGHNISNANTDGYSRQSVGIVTSTPDTFTGSYGKLQIGTGVDTQSITRARDEFMDQQYWKENTTLGYAQTQGDLMSQVEGVFSISSDTGMQKVLDNFWSAWQTLGSNASDDSTRNLVLQRGTELVNTIQQAADQLKDQVDSINTDLQLNVQTVNRISSDILSLNQKIAMAEVTSPGSANDLRDRRDLLVDQLSEYVPVQVTEDRSGNYIIQSGSATLVDGSRTTELTTAARTDADYGYPTLAIQANGIDVEFDGGSLQGLVDMRDDGEFGVKGYLNNLSTISEFLLRDFNAIHRAGYGEDNVGGRNFFGDMSTAYNETSFTNPEAWLEALQVNSALLNQTTDPSGLQMIAAKTADTQGNASGDNAVKLSQALRMNTTDLLPTGYTPTLGATASLNSYYSATIGTLGIQSASTTRVVTNQKTLVAQIENWRQSTCGVNMDEEMSDMIRFQKGYNAAARMITTMDELYDKLINSTGVVGR
ncbi:MAG: flagellar hook-associated protein FlgK [Veillonellaceae bacterium]|nr:flagellar hook-associated protein FlgK [Veillonellaceae bacterium]